MKRTRHETLTRLAALESFREEQLRQRLAANHASVTAAREQHAKDEQALLAIEAVRQTTIDASHADMARYMLYAACAEVAAERVERSTAACEHAQAELDNSTAQWVMGRARRDMASERAEQSRREALGEVVGKEMADAMDQWLAVEVRP